MLIWQDASARFPQTTPPVCDTLVLRDSSPPKKKKPRTTLCMRMHRAATSSAMTDRPQARDASPAWTSMSRAASSTSITFDGQEHVRIHNEGQFIFAVAGCLLSACRVAVVAACGGAVGAATALWTDWLDGNSLTAAVLGGATCAIVLLFLAGPLRPLPWRRYAARAAYCFAVFVYRCHGLISCAVRPWQRPYEPEAGRVLLSVQTNGMGHVVQALRLIELLKERGVLVDTVCFGDLAKVPHQHVAQLRRLLPDALLLDLGHEVDHDELGTSSLLYNLAATFCLVAAPQARELHPACWVFLPLLS